MSTFTTTSNKNVTECENKKELEKAYKRMNNKREYNNVNNSECCEQRDSRGIVIVTPAAVVLVST